MRERKKNKDDGLTARLVMAMADEMAACKRNTDRACIMFQALAAAAGVNVAHAFDAGIV